MPKIPSAAEPSDKQQLNSFQAWRDWKKGREVKMAALSERWSVSLPSPVSPQPPLCVLPQPVVFQSIGRQSCSHWACAQPGFWQYHPPTILSFSLCPCLLPPCCSHILPNIHEDRRRGEEQRDCRKEESNTVLIYLPTILNLVYNIRSFPPLCSPSATYHLWKNEWSG